jgi:hypothetical protein
MKSRFQNVPFKCNVHRYNVAFMREVLRVLKEKRRAVGPYRLNPVDP